MERKVMVANLAALSLVACGGSGGGGSNANPAEPKENSTDAILNLIGDYNRLPGDNLGSSTINYCGDSVSLSGRIPVSISSNSSHVGWVVNPSASLENQINSCNAELVKVASPSSPVAYVHVLTEANDSDKNYAISGQNNVVVSSDGFDKTVFGDSFTLAQNGDRSHDTNNVFQENISGEVDEVSLFASDSSVLATLPTSLDIEDMGGNVVASLAVELNSTQGKYTITDFSQDLSDLSSNTQYQVVLSKKPVGTIFVDGTKERCGSITPNWDGISCRF